MSSWSVESKGSAQTTSSSEAGSERPSPSVSRTASFQSTGTASVSSLSFTQPTSTSSASSAAGSSHSQQGQSQESQTSPTSTTGTQSPPEEVEEAKKPAGDSNSAKRMKKKLEAPKTVTTLMGGRGYINWRRTSVEKQRTSAHAQINNTDAFLVVWEMKL